MKPSILEPTTIEKIGSLDVEIEEEPSSKSIGPNNTSNNGNATSSSFDSNCDSSSSRTDEDDSDMVYVEKVMDDILKETTIETSIATTPVTKTKLKMVAKKSTPSWLSKRALSIMIPPKASSSRKRPSRIKSKATDVDPSYEP